jgi:hypothetical protein
MNTVSSRPRETYRKTAIIVGVFFILPTVVLFAGQALYGSILDSPNYLERAFPDRATAIAGILLEFAGNPAVALIPVLLFPVLKKHNEPLALGYAGFRLLETMFYIAALVCRLALIDLSRDHLSSGEMGAAYFQSIGGSILSGADWAFTIAVLFYTLGALMFYWILYRSKLIPRFISAWGFLAAAVMLVGTVLAMFDLMAADSVWGIAVMLPVPLNETVLAIWLIVKGFNPATIDPRAAQTDMNN